MALTRTWWDTKIICGRMISITRRNRPPLGFPRRRIVYHERKQRYKRGWYKGMRWRPQMVGSREFDFGTPYLSIEAK